MTRQRRHSWEKLAEHHYRCRRPDCGATAEKIPDQHGPGWFTTWTLTDGRTFSTRHGDRTPACEPVHAGRAVQPRDRGCGGGIGGGRVCGRRDTHLYPCGSRCDEHAPWTTRHGGDGIPPWLHGQYCVVRGHRSPAPDVAGWAAIDARAIASGKRRSSPENYQAARQLVEEQKADRRDLHLSGNSGR